MFMLKIVMGNTAYTLNMCNHIEIFVYGRFHKWYRLTKSSYKNDERIEVTDSLGYTDIIELRT